MDGSGFGRIFSGVLVFALAVGFFLGWIIPKAIWWLIHHLRFVILILALLPSLAWAQDCRHVSGGNSDGGASEAIAQQNCRIANALELIAEKLGEK